MKLVLAFLPMASALLMSGCGGSYEPSNARELVECYKTEFDADPSPAVAALQAKQIVRAGSGAQFLRFTADEATIDSILARGFNPINKVTFDQETASGNAPAWWRPLEDKMSLFFKHPNWKKHFGAGSQSTAYLACDADKKIVYFLCNVMD